jgi:lipopolysaccharide/colanic/teichoic acid biosynthesis glycosyltransferase
MYQLYIKRGLDIFFSLFALLMAFPIFLFLILTLWITNSSKPFFYQERPGKNGKVFSIIKFKTMTDKRDHEGNLLPDEQRLTKVGKFIRSTSLDELPQLINVFIGNMSLIGPRPLLVQYLPLYNEEQARRHEVRPGITGWAQVNGRNTISWTKKFELDVWYVDHCSFLLDMQIVYLTVKKVFRCEGISSDTSVTMEPFIGDN